MTEKRVVCVSCGAVNRLASDRDALSGRCGKCGIRLFAGRPIDVGSQMLERQVSKGTLPVLVDVWAPWCGPCRSMAPEYEKAAQAMEPRARFLKLNSDKEPKLAAALDIRGIPTTILFKQGKEVDRVSGAMQAAQIERWLREKLD